MRAATVALVLALPWATASAEPDGLPGLLAAMGAQGEARTAFVERRGSGLLSEPLLLRGELSRPDAGQLLREVRDPYAESSLIDGERVVVTRADGGERRFSIRRAPALQALRDGLLALLDGDAAALEAAFEVRMDTVDGRWRLQLSPRDARVREDIQRLDAFGADGALRCVLTREADGGLAWLLVGEAAVDAPDFEAECRLPLAERAAP